MGSRKIAVGSPPSPPPPPAEAAEPFEFPSSSSVSPTICIADDVISGGKLLPFCAPPPLPPARIISKTQVADSLLSGARIAAAGHRRLRKESDPNPDPIRRRRRRWYLLAFGSVKFPTGMELKEIRIRQQRKSAAKEEEEKWGPWELLRSLSCKGVEVAGDCHRRIVSPMTEMPLQLLRNDRCVAIS